MTRDTRNQAIARAASHAASTFKPLPKITEQSKERWLFGLAGFGLGAVAGVGTATLFYVLGKVL